MPGRLALAETVISRNLSEEARWPEWTPRVVSVLGIKAVMSLWLYTSLNPDSADSYGALNLYSDSIDPLGRMSTRSLKPWPRTSRLRLPRIGRFVAAASP